MFHWESVTTDIKSWISDTGKKLKEKLIDSAAAEEAENASPAETVAGQEQANADAAVPAGGERAEAEADPAEKNGDSADIAASEKSESLGRRMSDADLAAILLDFGWKLPADVQRDEMKPLASVSPVTETHSVEDLAAEVTAAMAEFLGEGISVYEEPPVPAETPEEEPASSAVPQTTAVFPGLGEEAEEHPPQEAAPSVQDAAEPPEPAAEKPAEEPEPAKHMNAKELFGSMNQEILKEVFSEEELSQLEGDDTHIFNKTELETISEKQAEDKPKKPKREKPDRRRTKLARSEEKPEEKKKAEKPQAQEPVYTARDYRPIRRSRNYRTGLRGGLMYFGFVVCVSIILASVAWLAADDVLSLNKDPVEAEIYVGEQVDMRQVSTELYNKGLIKYRALFRLFAKFMKAETKIDPGVYVLSSRLDYNAMIHAMKQSTSTIEERATVKVMIPEGKTLKQTFQILAEHGVCPYETLLECAANYEFKYDFLEDLPYGAENRLEGYLFPDTYEFFAPSDPEEAIAKFLSNFNSKVSLDMRQQAEEMGYSLQEVLTVASLIEMEAGKDTERATIASVIYNRLSSSYYPYLQVDATIQYALEERKESLTYEDLEIDSPYNTYKYTGLPPGPIANPGLASIRAALNPEDTGYYFYALNKSGTHNFFTTQSQFDYFVNSSEFGG